VHFSGANLELAPESSIITPGQKFVPRNGSG
jgi:hypothetical protein